jgi:eukaryotic-like serine/threonine-protein kinase
MATIGPGHLVADRYRLVRPDGGSAATRIWEAQDEVLGRTVTVREISGRKRMGMAEAQALAHQNRVLDVVEEPGRVWIVTTVSAGSAAAVGLVRLGDLTTELDRPGTPGAASSPPATPPASSPPATAPASSPPPATPEAASSPSATAPTSPAAPSGPPADAESPPAAAAPEPPAAPSPADTPQPPAAATKSPAADPWAGTPEVGAPAGPAAPSSAPPADNPGPAAPTTYPARPAGSAGRPVGGTRAPGSGFGALAARVGAASGRERPAWRRPRALILAVATLIVLGAGGGIALAATLKDGDSPASSKGAAGTPAAGTPAAGTTVAGPGAAGPAAASGSAAAPSTAASTVPAATFVPCGQGAQQGVMMGTDTTRQVAAGYIWHRDFQGFSFEVPTGWERSRVKNTFCFRDPAGGRGLVVTGGVSGTDAAAYFASQERAARRALPGYQRIDLTADGWEYTWKPSDGVVRHCRQVLVTPHAGTTYGLQWIAADARWATDEPVFAHILDTFELAPQS